MARPRKGKVPPQLRAYLFKKSGSRAPRRRRSSAPMARKRKRSGRSSGGGASISLRAILFSAGYGFVRRDIVSIAMPVISMVPAGDYADNLTLAGGAYLAAKFIKSPFVKEAAKTIVLNEAFLAGSKARSGANLMSSTTAASGARTLGGAPVLS